MSNYAIGDLQGCYKELQELLTKISFDKTKDVLWLCGDLVNRGPDSLNCLLYLYSIKDSCRVVLGNHDIHLIAVSDSIKKISTKDTFGDVLKSSKRKILIEWLKSCPLHNIEKILTNNGEKEFVMTHAGIPYHWTKDDLIKNSDELSGYLKSKNSNNFLENIYGDEPNHPDKCTNSKEKMRLNLNYLTRMRFYYPDGSIDLKYKGKVETAPENLKPWFEYELKIMNEDTHLIFGHWAALNGYTSKKNITALDTGCAWGNKLTAMRLEDLSIFSCDKLN
jgi:bis(5'-nucleosyl)-tetraphosphatase (symmetrical)